MEEMRSRSYRRWRRSVRKRKAAYLAKHVFLAEFDPRRIDLRCKCSCEMCGNPRKHFNELSIQERRHA